MKKFIEELLKQDNILIGYELEDGEHCKNDKKNIRQMLVRPITDENFIELWFHGQKHCSKFMIYLIMNDLFVWRRPDMINYETYNDEMFGKNIIKGAITLNNESIKLYNTQHSKSVQCEKDRLMDRFDMAVNHFIEVKDLGNGSYNILFEEC